VRRPCAAATQHASARGSVIRRTKSSRLKPLPRRAAFGFLNLYRVFWNANSGFENHVSRLRNPDLVFANAASAFQNLKFAFADSGSAFVSPGESFANPDESFRNPFLAFRWTKFHQTDAWVVPKGSRLTSLLRGEAPPVERARG